MNAEQWWQKLASSKVTVVGLGISNLPLIGFLTSHGISVTGRDKKDRSALSETAKTLESQGVRLFLGESYLEAIDEDVIFRSPGLRPDLPEFLAAIERGAILTSETELFLDLTPATVLGITGSDGKTTTTTLTGLFLEEETRRTKKGRVFVGGNIGVPLLPLVEEMTKDDFAVLELSSFQLQTMTRSAHRAALTNLSRNHLNWHRGMEEYCRAKTNLFRHGENQRLVANAENALSLDYVAAHDRPITWFSSQKTAPEEFALRPGDAAVYCKNGVLTLWDGENEKPMLAADRIRLPGKHNIENYMTAIALTAGLVSRKSIETVVDAFTGVRHRLEPVRVLRGVAYYNSSIDSSPNRTAAALSALAPRRPIVICGGKDKDLIFEPLADTLAAHAKAVVLTGETAPKIRAVLETCEAVQTGVLPIYHEPDFAAAVTLAHDIAVSGDIVLLSPACTSFDAFRNFEERGDTFCRLVKAFPEVE